MEILHQDESLVAVTKPSGTAVHASRYVGREQTSIAEILKAELGRDVFPVHRLDRATSGVLVFALSSQAARTLSEQFQARQTRKEYLAIVRGHPPEKGRIDRALERADGEELQDAATDYERLAVAELPVPIDRYPSMRLALVRAIPQTGRMHQIRRHLRGINHPILCDSSYGDGAANRLAKQELGAERLLLHAWRLEIAHPGSGLPLSLVSPLPPEFQAIFTRVGWHVPSC
jgi:tRNA pseudouridine65 synthase